MSLALTSKRDILHDRAQMFAKVRHFFQERDVVEVDVPMLSTTAPVDPYIDLVTATCMGKRCYLHSSPEFGMKKLLAMGVGDCYQLSHVYRDGELGEKHSPEFTMLEWYRVGGTFDELIQETVDLISLFIGELKPVMHHYEDLFWEHVGRYPQSIEERDNLFALSIEPHLEGLAVVSHYPPEQALLAKTEVVNGEVVARRFEIFYDGVELANGFDELCDMTELKRRFVMDQDKRLSLGKERYPLDEELLASDLPPCCGVAVGFDRLMQLRHNVSQIQDILPLSPMTKK